MRKFLQEISEEEGFLISKIESNEKEIGEIKDINIGEMLQILEILLYEESNPKIVTTKQIQKEKVFQLMEIRSIVKSEIEISR